MCNFVNCVHNTQTQTFAKTQPADMHKIVRSFKNVGKFAKVLSPKVSSS